MEDADRTRRHAKLNRRAVLASGGAFALTAFAAPGDPLAMTQHGPMTGVKRDGLFVFKGVRYGADTSTSRFARPRAPLSWRDALPATDYGHAAPQAGREPDQSEDCLFLNVWTPGLADGGKRPVLIYFHGGAYNSGSGSDALYDGSRLAARQDVVVITVNHRLNAFGYLYLDRLLPGAFPDSGNAGQWDLVLALDWVKANARAFGGDPARVMVFGQSGGGAKIATLMATPAARGLFQAAATMSGQQVTASGPLNATRRAEAYLARLGLAKADASVLKTMPMAKLIEALDARDPLDSSQGLYFGPVLDERMLTRHPFWPDAPAQSANIPMILGNARDETRTLIGRREPELFDLSFEALPAALARHMRSDLHPDEVVRTYRAAFPSITPTDLFFRATTAGRSWRGQVEEADARAQAGHPTWVYQFDIPWTEENGKWGAPHTVDIGYAFGNLDAAGAMPGEAPFAERVSRELGDAFVALARRGRPGGKSLPKWPQYRLPDRQTLVLDERTRAVADPRKIERELFAKVPFVQWGT